MQKKQDFNLTFEERNKNGRINLAEEKAIEYYNKIDASIIRMGNDEKGNKIPYKKIIILPDALRNMPEFIVIKNNAWFVEVKGGRDFIRIKLCDMDNYKWWDNLFKSVSLVIFMYSTKLDTCKQILFKDLIKFIESNKIEIDVYEDNKKEYYKIPVESIF
tara:strand:- start:12434 stop:12913 length:480 start_codon:yes stop_codon:yes gene_type:complete